MSNWFENHQPQRTQTSTGANAYFIQNSNQMASSVDCNCNWVFRAYSFKSCNVQGIIQAFRLSGLLWWQKLTSFSRFFSTFLDFAFQFCFRCKFFTPLEASRVKFDRGWFFWTNRNSLLRIATNEIASFWIDNRLRQMAFLFSPKWRTRKKINE